MNDLINNSSESLAAQIVVYRSLGMQKEVAIQCMQELANRKAAGDEFDYEKFIEEKMKEIPKVEDFNILTMLKK